MEYLASPTIARPAGALLQSWHQIEIGPYGRGIRAAEILVGAVEYNLSLIQHDDARLQAEK